jgi:hypothetical protein
MYIKRPRLLSDRERFFRFESLLEPLHTKNVVEVSVLRCTPEKIVRVTSEGNGSSVSSQVGKEASRLRDLA